MDIAWYSERGPLLRTASCVFVKRKSYGLTATCRQTVPTPWCSGVVGDKLPACSMSLWHGILRMNPGTERRFLHNFSQGSSGKNWQQDFAGRTKQEGERSDVHPQCPCHFSTGMHKGSEIFYKWLLSTNQKGWWKQITIQQIPVLKDVNNLFLSVILQK